MFSNTNMKELLTKWSELQNQPRNDLMLRGVGFIQQRWSDELQILEALLAAGYTGKIPGEDFDVSYLINDRKRSLREMNDSLS
jgi:hypothetical protein